LFELKLHDISSIRNSPSGKTQMRKDKGADPDRAGPNRTGPDRAGPRGVTSA